MTSPDNSAFKIIVHSVSHEVPDLTDEEKQQLEAVIQKAKEFEEEEKNAMKKPIEGQLYKYTNVVRGWQFRWFVLTPETGMLEYYMMDEPKKNRPKGGVHLGGAVVLPSEEDSNSFTISALCGEIFRLKAADAKERQFWVSRLRTTAEQYTQPIEILPGNNSSSRLSRTQSQSSKEPSSPEPSPKSAPRSSNGTSPREVPTSESDSVALCKDSLASIKECVDNASSYHKALAKTIEQLPMDGPHLKCSDSALLLLKATAQATVQSLEYCYLILKQREQAKNHPRGLPAGATIRWIDAKKPLNDTNTK